MTSSIDGESQETHFEDAVHWVGSRLDLRAADPRVLLRLYGLFKQVTQGSRVDANGQAGWPRMDAKKTAWDAEFGTEGESAMRAYVELAESVGFAKTGETDAHR